MNEIKAGMFFIKLMFVFLAYPANADSQNEADKKSQHLQLFAPEVKFVRSTKYSADEPNGDAGTKEGRTATEVPIASLKKTGLGAVAVDPKEIPFGSIVIDNNGKKYLAVDTGGAVKNRSAAKKLARKKGLNKYSKEYNAPVCDFYGQKQVGGEWSYVTVIKYVGEKPFLAFTRDEKKRYIELISRAI